MCGIVGVIGSQNATSIIIEGLKKLEYRGYDSAGVAVVENNEFKFVKEEGKIVRLEEALKNANLNSEIAIGHTRWATHGKPSKENSHPHFSNKICVVHNGIVENHQELKAELAEKLEGFSLLSQTDTEVIPHLIEYYFNQTGDVKESLLKATSKIEGSFALAVMFKDNPNIIAVAKRGSPIVLGLGNQANYVASDYYALSSHVNNIISLDDDEFAIVAKDNIEVFGLDGHIIAKSPKTVEFESSEVSKDGYEHFMLKEIYEQPRVLADTIEAYVNLKSSNVHLPNFAFDLKSINKITIVACGTSYYAGLCAKYLIEDIAKVEVEVDIASEFRYRSHPFRDDNLMVFISQSGETADTLAALKFAKENNQKILSIVNAPHSTMAQLSNSVIRTVAGPEIGVASTKAYTAQIAVLSLFAIHLGSLKGSLSRERKVSLLQSLVATGPKMLSLFEEASVKNIKKVAQSLVEAKHILYIGRGVSQVSAFEAALKFRELSYIDAQGVAAGELKHGTIALIDEEMPVIVIAPHNLEHHLFEKTISNAQEVGARGGNITFISDKVGIEKSKDIAQAAIEIPALDNLLQEAILPVIPTQLLAYYVSLFRGNDVDQPRNLAKSVTVE